MRRSVYATIAMTVVCLSACNSGSEPQNLQPAVDSPPAESAATNPPERNGPQPSTTADNNDAPPFTPPPADAFNPVPEAKNEEPPTPGFPNASASSGEEASAGDGEAASDDNAIKSIGRVLRGTLTGDSEEDEDESGGSVFGAVGRALSKGFEEAASGNATDENAPETKTP